MYVCGDRYVERGREREWGGGVEVELTSVGGWMHAF